MAELVACIGEDKGILHVKRLIEEQDWANVAIVTSTNIKIETGKKVQYIVLPEKKTLSELTEHIRYKLKGTIKGPEVGVNFYSGSGKEHMAVLSALLKLGLGIRLVALTPNGVKEI